MIPDTTGRSTGRVVEFGGEGRLLSVYRRLTGESRTPRVGPPERDRSPTACHAEDSGQGQGVIVREPS